MDTSREPRPPYQRGRFRGNQRGRGRGRGLPPLGRGKPRDPKRIKRWGPRGPPHKIRDASVTVKPDWVTIEEMDFLRLSKLSLPGVKDGLYYFRFARFTNLQEFFFKHVSLFI